MNCRVQIQYLHPNAKLPYHRSKNAMGYDLHCIADADFCLNRHEQKMGYTLFPGRSHMFKTGIAMAISEGFGALLWDRSGMGVKLVHRLAGVIDSDYRGEWKVILTNLSNNPIDICEGDRIVQAIFTEQVVAHFEEVDVLPETQRGTGGFGSTGD
jgi:dUTP pyrophosphatase